MPKSHRIRHHERGSSSIELIGLLPAILLLALIGAQVAVTGHALWSAAVSARAGARAAQVGNNARSAALSALPGLLRSDAEVEGTDAISVDVSVPRVLPFLPSYTVSAQSSLGRGDG